MSIRIDGSALQQKHAQFLVLHLQRLARPSSAAVAVDARLVAEKILRQLVETYPEVVREDVRNPFEALAD